MYWTRKHVLVCTASHCAQKGANEVVGKLRLDVLRKGLDAEILVNNCGTIDLCDIGPNVVVYPDNVILSGVTVKDVPQLVAYLQGQSDPPGTITAYDSPEESNRRAFYQEALTCGESCDPVRFSDIAEHYGLDQTWIDEQARRGFVARKPSPESGEPSISITKKAIERYQLNRAAEIEVLAND